MNPPGHIRHLQRQEIDLAKWDLCIESAPNGLIYGRSFFLDAITAGQWDALVLGDYRAVMPLTWNKKFGFYYLYQPFCTPCLGIFGSQVPSESSVSAFLQAIPKKFKFWDIDLNETNRLTIPTDLPLKTTDRVNHFLPIKTTYRVNRFLPLKTTDRVNHFLPLNKKAEELEQNYKRLTGRMLKRAASESFEIIRDIGPRDVIDLYRRNYQIKHPGVKTKSYDRLTACAEKAFTKGHAQTYLALSPHGNIAAFYLLFSDKKFVYSALGGSTPEGKEKGAFYLLTDAAIKDAVIKDHADRPRVFRFEGSDIPGIASFDASFGAVPVRYPHLLMNRLPFPINLLK